MAWGGRSEANIFAIVATILLHLASISGLGEYSSARSRKDGDTVLKLVYASQIHEVFAILFAKASTAFLMGRIIPQPSKFKIILSCLILGWAMLHLFAVAFQCPLPSPWNSRPSECRTHGIALYPAMSFNALTDIILGLWIVPGVWKLKMAKKHRLSVIFLFGFRTCVSIPIVSELVLLKSFFSADDQIRSNIARFLLNQGIVYLSIICANPPRTNQFLGDLQYSGTGLEMRVPDFLINSMATVARSVLSSNATKSKSRRSQLTSEATTNYSEDSQRNEAPLRLVPEPDNILSTEIHASVDQKNGGRAGMPGNAVFRKSEFSMKVSDRDGVGASSA